MGHYHPSVWTLIDAVRQDNAVAETEIAKSHRGQPPKKRVKRATIQLQERLQKICRDRATNICCGDIECCCAHDSLSVVSETGYVNENRIGCNKNASCLDTGWRKKRPEHSHALWSKLLTDF